MSPTVGTIVWDKQADDDIPSLAVVVHECVRPASDCYIHDLDQTVADVNPDCDPTGGVVDVQFMGAFLAWSDVTYSYPVERLDVVKSVHRYVHDTYPHSLQPVARKKLARFVKRVDAAYGTYPDGDTLEPR